MCPPEGAIHEGCVSGSDTIHLLGCVPPEGAIQEGCVPPEGAIQEGYVSKQDAIHSPGYAPVLGAILADSSAESEGSSESSASEEEALADPAQEPQLVPTATKGGELRWFVLKNRPKLHFVQSYEGAAPVAYCQQKPFATGLQSLGNGVAAALDMPNEVCGACFKRMPRRLSAMLTDSLL